MLWSTAKDIHAHRPLLHMYPYEVSVILLGWKLTPPIKFPSMEESPYGMNMPLHFEGIRFAWYLAFFCVPFFFSVLNKLTQLFSSVYVNRYLHSNGNSLQASVRGGRKKKSRYTKFTSLSLWCMSSPVSTYSPQPWLKWKDASSPWW